MFRNVTVGLDGSPESMAAAEWAAREAKLRDLSLKLINVWEPVPAPMAQAPLLGAETQAHWSERIPREAAEGLRLRHPGVKVTVEQTTGRPAGDLARAGHDADLLVLGTRGLSGIGGFLLGSVGLAVLSQAEHPVVFVRAGEQAADEHEMDPTGIPSAATPYRPVVLGLDIDHADDSLIEFAFEEAARRGTALGVVHGWKLPPSYAYGLSAGIDLQDEIGRQKTARLSDLLRPWQQKHPAVEVIEQSRPGSASVHLVHAALDASLVVVGRRIRRSPLGAHTGPVTHAVLHHSTAPVAVVSHN